MKYGGSKSQRMSDQQRIQGEQLCLGDLKLRHLQRLGRFSPTRTLKREARLAGLDETARSAGGEWVLQSTCQHCPVGVTNGRPYTTWGSPLHTPGKVYRCLWCGSSIGSKPPPTNSTRSYGRLRPCGGVLFVANCPVAARMSRHPVVCHGGCDLPRAGLSICRVGARETWCVCVCDV